MCIACFHKPIMHSLVSPHTPHTLPPLPCSWNSSRMQEPSQLLTPPSSIHFKAPSKPMHGSSSVLPTKPAILPFKTSVWGSYNCILTCKLWYRVKNLSCTKFYQASIPFCDKSSFNLLPLLLALASFFWASSLTCPITSSENTLYFLSKGPNRAGTVAICTHCPQHLPAPYNPCTTAKGVCSNMHRITIVKTHAAVGAGETEELQQGRELTLLLPCACSHKEEKRERNMLNTDLF